MGKNILVTAKIFLALFTLIYLPVILSGAGLVFNADSYGIKLVICGIIWIISGLLMISGSIFCIIGKNVPSLICSLTGFLTCMIILLVVASHAEKYFWTMPFYDNFPVADMYRKRIILTIIPFALTILISGRKICGK